MLIAASSLDMSQRQSDLIANNVANASTPGYVDRELPQSELVAGGVGMGVVAGIVQRLGDAVAADAANQATGAQAYSQQMVNVTRLLRAERRPAGGQQFVAVGAVGVPAGTDHTVVHSRQYDSTGADRCCGTERDPHVPEPRTRRSPARASRPIRASPRASPR